MLTREQILAADDLPSEKVSCPEWGGDLLVRTMNGRDREKYEKELVSRKNPDGTLRDVGSVLLAATICDEAGNLLFSFEDVEALSKKSGKVATRIFTVANRLNPLFGRDIDELAKNS